MRIFNISYEDAFYRLRNLNNFQPGLESLAVTMEKIFSVDRDQASSSVISPELETYFSGLTSKEMPFWFINRGFSWKSIIDFDIRWDRWQDEIVIPVKKKVEIVGLINRVAPGAPPPKYRYSKGFEKSKYLFGRISPGEKSIMLVEGPLDAIWCVQCGIPALSLLGSLMSKAQIQELMSYRFSEVVLGLDSDEVGQEAIRKITGQLLEAGYLLPQIKLVRWPTYAKDPQECDIAMLREYYNKKIEVIDDILRIP